MKIDDETRKRRERLFWICAGIVALFMLCNSMGIVETGHFERDHDQQMQDLSDSYKEFWEQWNRTW